VRLAEVIELDIVSGKIAPDERIGTEAELCEQFGVNRSTVREAIRLLEQSGLLQRDQSRRLCASLPKYNYIASRASRALVLHQTTFRELWEAALSLEAASVEAAFNHHTVADIAGLRANLKRSRETLGVTAKVIEFDTEFHSLLSKSGKNRILQLAREPVSMLFAPTMEIILAANDTAAQRNLEAHEKIVDALEDRDLEEATRWMRRHINDWKRGFELAGRSLDEPLERAFIKHSSGMRAGHR
jgi:DNA-binding FadR family transcriptional regulator